MESGYYLDWHDTFSSFFGSENIEDKLEEGIVSEEILSQIPQPQTPWESIKFLSRSLSLSASEISKAIAQKQRRQRDLFSVAHSSPKVFFQNVSTDPLMAEKIMNSSGNRSPRRLSKWFHHKQQINPSSMRISKKKDKARVEKIHVHTTVSIAAPAAGLASVTSEESSSKESSSTMTLAIASATDLLATHCIEMAEQAGADRTCIASKVKSSIDFHTPCDLMTLTAAAATALRGEAALKARQPKESRKKASITPCEKSFSDSHSPENCQLRLEEPNIPLDGELVQCAQNGDPIILKLSDQRLFPLLEMRIILNDLLTAGVQRIKRVCIYISKKSQVMIKLKSKHYGRAFSKKIKCIVYGVYDELSAWHYEKERENSEVYFSLETGQGLLEFLQQCFLASGQGS